MPDELDASVGVLCYNGRRFLDDCLKSLLDQDFPGRYEIFVLDNASTDGSGDYVRARYPQVRVVRVDPPNIGFTGAVNRVVAESRSRYACAVNVDTVFHRRWLAEMWQAMRENPRAKMAQSNAIFPWWHEFAAQERDRLVEQAYVCDVTSFGIHDYRVAPVTPNTQPIPTLGGNGAALMFDRTIVDELGYIMDTDFYCYAEDLDCALRINALGYQVLFVPKAVVYHNSAWQVKFDRRSLSKAILSTRNTFLTFYKLSYWHEYVALLPFLIIGNFQKAQQHVFSPWVKWLALLAAVPQTFLAFVAALGKFHLFRDKRRQILSHRVGDRWWLTREMLRRDWHPDPDVWFESKAAERQYTASSGQPG